MGGVNYLIPITVDLASDRDLRRGRISARVMAATDGAKKLRLIMRTPAATPFRDDDETHLRVALHRRGLAASSQIPSSRLCGQGMARPRWMEWGATARLQPPCYGNIAKPNLEIGQLFRLIRDDVRTQTIAGKSRSCMGHAWR